MPPYVTPNLGEAPEAMQKEADKVYKGLRETKFHKETPGDRESASRIMWSVLKKTWKKDPETGKWTKKTNVVNSVYNESPTTYNDSMTLIGVGTDDRPDSNYDPDELRMGIETEMEHTADASIASKIAKDQLDENPRFYSDYKEREETSKAMYNIALQSIYDIDGTRKSLVAMKGTGDNLVEYDLNKAIEGLDRAKTVAQMIVDKNK
jgi:hypothetical protein